jgi:polynucleotide 5'-kinase involved in rRNA processing
VVVVFVIGTAGSGKSLLTASLTEWLKVGKQKAATVNLDPGVVNSWKITVLDPTAP